ncbi:MAG: peptidylprolyl isomerase [Pseudohongiellaceae bacterium]
MNFRYLQRCLLFLVAGIGLYSPAVAQSLSASIDTSRGVIEVQLNERAAPTTVANFVNLALRGFYDGLSFHRVERNFMIQGGDPLATGSGGPGYRFSGEIVLHHNQPGIISMANSGPGTDGSQFFITHLATAHLDGLHSVFGRVTAGLEIVYQIQRGDRINSIRINGDPLPVLSRRSTQLAEWNRVLDENFPGLRPLAVSLP